MKITINRVVLVTLFASSVVSVVPAEPLSVLSQINRVPTEPNSATAPNTRNMVTYDVEAKKRVVSPKGYHHSLIEGQQYSRSPMDTKPASDYDLLR